VVTDVLGTGNKGKAGAALFELPGYSDIRQIGAGGMAVVYSATQQSFNRKVAIKVLMPSFTADTEFADRFLREAQIVSSLSHPHIIPVYDFGQRNGTFYIVMEYLAGGDLAKKIPKGLSEEEILQITRDVAAALHFAHAKGFIHRDVKPDNVMFREDNSAVLTDFGIARKQNANTQMTRAGQTVGTPKYMSPQQLQGRAVDGRSDIYSLGIMFYEMLVKQTPYQDEDFMALAMKHLQAPIPKLPQKFARYQKLFERMVAKEPEKRFQSGEEVVRLIDQIRSGKADAAGIDSGTAAVLKASLAKHKEVSTSDIVHLPREVLVDLQDMDPLFDNGWQKKVALIFNKLKPQDRKRVYEQFLAPERIYLDPQKKQFVFRGRASVHDLAQGQLSNPELRNIAQKMQGIEVTLRSANEASVFADNIEAGLSLIDRFDAQDSLVFQKERLMLRAAFLDDLVPLIRETTFTIPANRRELTSKVIQSYIVDVYLRQQVMGYRFKTMSYASLEEHPNAFIRSHVAKEARIRECDLVKSADTLYLIGPVRDHGKNPYSIRRFLQEESAMDGQMVYFNAIAVQFDSAGEVVRPKDVEWQLSRVVTLQRQLSLAISELVQKLEDSYRNELRPMLLKEIAADGTDIEESIRKRLVEYERRASLLVLGKIPKALRELATTNDDFEYLFINLRRLIIEMACDVRDFTAQSAAALSDRAQRLDIRMMSYLKLLDKRKTRIFSPGFKDTLEPALDPSLLLQELKKALDECEEQLALMNDQLRELISETSQKKKGGFLQSLFGSKEEEITPDMLYAQIDREKQKCLLALIRIIKRYPLITVYLEFESITPVKDGVRHYALMSGKEQIGRLPALMVLDEKPGNFNMPVVRRMLEEDAFSATAWSGTGH
jgi:serine/threonine protein kinase